MRKAGSLAIPYSVGLGLLIGLPAIAAVALAFTDFTGVAAPTFVGLDNFRRLAGDEGFWRSLGNSGIYILISVPVRLVLAVTFALLLNRRGHGVGAARATVYLPTIVPDVAYAFLWLWLLNPLYGPLPLVAEALGFEPSWLTDPGAARVSLALVAGFQIGEAFVVALAARHSIPGAIYEAAEVDGLRPIQVLSRITLPIMAPILALLVLRDVVYSLQATFVPALVITDGGPRYATTYLPLYIYRQAFRYFRFGYASAMTMSMFVLTAVVIYVAYRLARRWRIA